MEMTLYDLCSFGGFLLLVVVWAMARSRKRKTADDFFLAGRSLNWFVIGISLVTLNIFMEHFVRMGGRGFQVGLAIASYEWMAAVALVLVALFLLPKFLRLGITTIPEYLEHRYSASARGLMAFYLVVAYVFVAIAAMLYAGSVSLKAIFGDRIEQTLVNLGLIAQGEVAQWSENWLLVAGIWLFGIVAGIYTIWGGLKAVVWANWLTGLGLVFGGLAVLFLGFLALGQAAADQDAVRKAEIQAAAAVQPAEEDPAAAPSDSGPPAKPEAGAKTDAGAKAETEAAPEAAAQPDPSPAEAESDSEPEAKAKPEAGAEADAGAKPEAGAEADAGAKPEAGAEEETEEAPEAAGPPAVLLAGQAKLPWHEKLTLGVETFFVNAGDKLSAVKPFDHRQIPWLAVLLGGLWISQIFFWGLNQSATQRALGAQSLVQGQKGMMFAACLKLLIPFFIIFPAIMAYQLYGHVLSEPDEAYPRLIGEIVPAGVRGLMVAILFGALLSCTDSMLHSASTIFTLDFVQRWRKEKASDRSLVRTGRWMTALFVVIACGCATLAAKMRGDQVFDYIQVILGFISPGLVAAFVFGLMCKRAPAVAAVGAMLLGIPVYGWLLWMLPGVAFLHHMAFTFIVVTAYMMLVTVLLPLRDVVASSEEAEAGEPSDGFARRFLVPYGTAFFGGLLLAVPVFTLSHVATVRQGYDVWVHLTSTGVVLVVYVAVTLSVMRCPTPSVRRVVAEAKRRSFFYRAGRSLVRAAFALIVGAVLGLHVYLFGTWTASELQHVGKTTPLLKPTLAYLEPYLVKSFQVAIPAVVLEREMAQTLVEPEQPVGLGIGEGTPEEEDGDEGDEEGGAKQRPGRGGMPGEEGAAKRRRGGPPMAGEEGGAKPRRGGPPMAGEEGAAKPRRGGQRGAEDEGEDEDGEDEGEAAAADVDLDTLREEQIAWPNLNQQVDKDERVSLGSGFLREERTMSVFIVPLALAGVAVVLFWIGLLLIWSKPAAGEAELPVTDKIDLKPSVVVPLWGLVILVVTGALYWVFF